LVANGPDIWPGAKAIKRHDGKIFDISVLKDSSDVQLDYGFKVERHLVDDDIVVFNR